MESVYEEKSRFRMSKRKALVIALSIFAVAIVVSEPVYASVPWYITTIGIVAGGIVGSLTGSPIGTIAGAEAGAMIADYLYSADHKTNSLAGYSDNQLYANEFGASYENLTSQELVNTEHSDNTSIQLLSEDYYYNAQAEEAISMYYLNQTSLSCFNTSLASGSYASLNNVSLSLYSPVDTVLWQTWFTGRTDNNGYFNTTAIEKVGIEGSTLESGNYILVQPQNLSTELFRNCAGSVYVNLQNFYSGKIYNLSSNGVMPFNTHSIPSGIYKIVSLSGTIITAGIEILPTGAISTNYPDNANSYGGAYTDYNEFIGIESMFAASQEASSTRVFGVLYTGQSTSDYYYPSVQFFGLPNYYTDLQADLSKYFTSASTYFSSLKELGFTNISQLPSNDVIPFPSDVVPNSLVNGNFTLQELESLYFAYLNDLNNTFHNTTVYNGHNYTKYFNQSEFVNGFLTVYGNLTWTTGTTIHYLNNTDFFIQTYSNKLFFEKGHTTSMVGETYPVLVLNGTQNGTLLYVDASIYVINLQLAGKNITSYTLEPEQITYVLPKITSIGPPQPPQGSFILGSLTEYLVIAVLVIVVLSAVVIGMAKKGHKDKKKRAN